MARIIRLLLDQRLLTAEPLPHDGRRTRLRVSLLGQQTLDAVQPVVLQNRSIALEGLSEADIRLVRDLLERIYQNCLPPA
ncbi:hypothetical protein [Hymenobacter sp. AT01-02]|uniref:hypothetical protein n=1 Tax=Hymenobacter sp. AT01-02 TaxID=1571877 RepID=UPI001F45319E|nr:hypothetical protein [Hymenobacter sp. AT01-02]